MHHGTCLCGTVRFEVSGPIIRLNLCHCRMCQKAHGAAFAPYVRVNKTDFRFVGGQEQVQTYISSPGITRSFCRVCGATLQWIRDAADGLGVAAGVFDSELDLVPSAQFYCVENQAWHALRDDVPKYETEPDG